MGLLTRLTDALRTRTETDTYVYDVTGMPPQPWRAGGQTRIRPTRVTVTFTNGRFAGMEEAGEAVDADVRVTARYRRERDVPDWAAAYLQQAVDDQRGEEPR